MVSQATMVSEYKSIHGEGVKILTPKQMLQRLPIALPQVKASNISEKWPNQITQIIRQKVYNNVMNSIKL